MALSIERKGLAKVPQFGMLRFFIRGGEATDPHSKIFALMEFSFISGSFCLHFFGDKCDEYLFPEWHKAFGTQLPVVQRWLNNCTMPIVLPVFE